MNGKLIALVTALLLAGCVDGADLDETDAAVDAAFVEDGAPPDAEAAAPRVHRFTVTADAAVIVQPGVTVITGGAYSDNFRVPAGATALLAEAAWSCASPTCDVRFALRDATGTWQEVEAADGAGRGVIGSPASGSWQGVVEPRGAVAGMTGEVRVTVFFEGDVPPGYSAFGGA